MIKKRDSYSFLLIFLGLLHSSRCMSMGKISLVGICDSVSPHFFFDLQQNLKRIDPPRRLDQMTLEFIGKGNYGKVYKGVYEGNTIAVKVANKSELNFREAKILHQLKNTPGIPKLIGCEVGDNNLYIYQQLLGIEMSKAEAVETMKSKSLSEILILLTNLAKTLYKLHANFILHRDIKPDNMMADSNIIEEIYMIDFGLSGPAEFGLKVGTPLYWSPNVFNKSYRIMNQADDVFSMGLSMAEMLYGNKEIFSKEYEKCISPYYADNCQLLISNKISHAFALRNEKYKNQCGPAAVNLFFDALMQSISYNEINRLTSEQLFNQLNKAKNECFRYIEDLINIKADEKPVADPVDDLPTTSRLQIEAIESAIAADLNKPAVDVKKNVAIPGDDRAEPKLNPNNFRSIMEKDPLTRAKSLGSRADFEIPRKKSILSIDAEKNQKQNY